MASIFQNAVSRVPFLYEGEGVQQAECRTGVAVGFNPESRTCLATQVFDIRSVFPMGGSAGAVESMADAIDIKVGSPGSSLEKPPAG